MSKIKILITTILIGSFISINTYAMEGKNKKENLIQRIQQIEKNKKQYPEVTEEEIKEDVKDLKSYSFYFTIIKNAENIYEKDEIPSMEKIKDDYINDCENIKGTFDQKKTKVETRMKDTLSKELLERFKLDKNGKSKIFSLEQLKKDIITAVKKMDRISRYEEFSKKYEYDIKNVRNNLKKIIEKYYKIRKGSSVDDLREYFNKILNDYIMDFNKDENYFKNMNKEKKIKEYKQKYEYLISDIIDINKKFNAVIKRIFDRIKLARNCRDNLFIYLYKFAFDEFVESCVNLANVKGITYFEQDEKFASVKPSEKFNFIETCKPFIPKLKAYQTALNEDIEEIFSDENIKLQENMKTYYKNKNDEEEDIDIEDNSYINKLYAYRTHFDILKNFFENNEKSIIEAKKAYIENYHNLKNKSFEEIEKTVDDDLFEVSNLKKQYEENSEFNMNNLFQNLIDVHQLINEVMKDHKKNEDYYVTKTKENILNLMQKIKPVDNEITKKLNFMNSKIKNLKDRIENISNRISVNNIKETRNAIIDISHEINDIIFKDIKEINEDIDKADCDNITKYICNIMLSLNIDKLLRLVRSNYNKTKEMNEQIKRFEKVKKNKEFENIYKSTKSYLESAPSDKQKFYKELTENNKIIYTKIKDIVEKNIKDIGNKQTNLNENKDKTKDIENNKQEETNLNENKDKTKNIENNKQEEINLNENKDEIKENNINNLK